MDPITGYGYVFEEAGAPLRRTEFTIETVTPGEIVVEVAGCGLCHTDLSFFAGQVKPNRLPIVLGHEISGTVIAAGDRFASMIGRAVVVPAVMPCGDCQLCVSGRSNVCRHQVFPGNDFDGGFATHVTVPGRFLCPVPEDTGGLPLSSLSVIADAITTPYQSMLRSRVQPGELAVVVGVGGIGTYMVQWAKYARAMTIALDVDDRKLENARRMGADYVLNINGLSESDIKKAIRSLVKEEGLPKYGWKVFETSGTAGGQTAAFSLLSFAGVILIVGFTMDKVNVRLSNVMAFDAEIIGNWACKPEHYADVVKEVLAGQINVRDNIEERPLDSINDVLELALEHKLERRVVFVP
jgi:6-hydroxycyclohex-1-ene-1-carbonyl-CoA dehydrogenase